MIKQYKAINLNDKTEESIKLFQSDLVQAESLINNPQSQQHVDAFYHKFLNSAGKLRKKETVSIKHERSESNTYRLGDEVRSQTFLIFDIKEMQFLLEMRINQICQLTL